MWFIFLLWLLIPFYAFADHSTLRNDTFNTVPDASQSTFRANSMIFWDHEEAQREGRHFSPFVWAGGLHGNSATLTSPAFATEAFVPERVSQTSTAIVYPALPADVCFTIISADNNGITGWTRTGTTAYYTKCQGNTTVAQAAPPLPPNSAWLVRVQTVASAITTVVDLRQSNGRGGTVLNVRDPLWGCTGDGVADDTTCWQTIANRLKNVTTNQEQRFSIPHVEVPAGIYLITDTIDWGGTLNIHVVGTGGAWDCTVVPGVSCLKWGGTTGKPIWWFKQNTFDVMIEGLGFYGADEALRFRNVSSPIQNGKVTLRRNFFSHQANTAIWLGYDFADTTSTADMTNFVVEDSYFDPTTLQAVACNVADNFYGLFMARNYFYSHATLINQGCQNISITDSTIIANGTQATTDYPIDLVSGGGWFNLSNIVTENALLLNMRSWNGSAGLFATLTNITVNSQVTYAAIGSVPTIILRTPSVLTNVQVSSPTGPKIRHINALNGYVKIGGAYLDVYDTQDLGVFVGYSPDGYGLDLFQRTDTAKGLRVQRSDDTTPTGNVVEVSRFDKASAVFRVGANGDVVTIGNFVGNQAAFSSLTSSGAAGGKKVVCVDLATGRLYASSTGIDCTN